VTSTKPGTTVPVRVVRNGAERSLSITVDELDYGAENQAPRQRERQVEPQDDRSTSRDFGLDLQSVNAQLARQLQLKDARGAVVRNVDMDGPAAGVLMAGDVIVEINAQAITSAAEADRELKRVPAGGTVKMRIVREGRRRFLTLVKE
jgi:serine protease Do